MKHEIIQPDGWPPPRGYAHGVVAAGRRALYVAGQIGWNADHELASDELVGQLGQALDNVLEVVRAAGGAPSDVVNMTLYVTDIDEYRGAVGKLGAVWRERFGTHYPAMALVGVAALVVPASRVEIQAIASLPEEEA